MASGGPARIQSPWLLFRSPTAALTQAMEHGDENRRELKEMMLRCCRRGELRRRYLLKPALEQWQARSYGLRLLRLGLLRLWSFLMRRRPVASLRPIPLALTTLTPLPCRRPTPAPSA